MVAGHAWRNHAGCAGLGIPHLHGKYHYHLAAVRNRQSIAGDDRAGGMHHVPGEHGEGEVCVGHGGAYVLRSRDHADGRRFRDPDNLLAANPAAGQGVPRLLGLGFDEHLYRRCRAGAD